MKFKNISLCLKKCWFTIAILLVHITAYAQACFPGDDGCEIDAPLDTHLWVLLVVAGLLSVAALARRHGKTINF